VARQTLPGARPNREAPVCFDYCLRVRPLEAFGNKCPRGMIASASCEFIRCEDRTRLTVLRYFFYSVSNEEFSVYFCERADIVSFTTFAILAVVNLSQKHTGNSLSALKEAIPGISFTKFSLPGWQRSE